jgi:NADH pyrophosphatase NudC (nudix superfamily)
MRNRRDGEEYENIVEKLGNDLFNLAKPESGFLVNSGHSNKWEGVSRYPHQIDVSVESSSFILLVECKNWSKNVDVPSFLTFLARIIDIKSKDTNKEVFGKIVTTQGYDPGVQQLASHYKIKLDKVKNEQEFLLTFQQYGIAGVTDQANSTESITIFRRCGICSSKLISDKAGDTYICPNCSNSQQ